MNLVMLAQNNSLPLIQWMDIETLEWIKENRPNFNKASQPQIPIILKNVKKFRPSRKWFLKDDCFDSIHGIRHIMRVIANASNLIINREINPTVARNLLIACSLHDLRRMDDRGDLGHAKRATEWFFENRSLIAKKFTVDLTKKDLDEISTAICLHEISYSKIEASDKYLQHKKIVDLLKTADTLDRYRLPKLKWWINDKFIRLKPPDGFKKFAYDLVLLSEKEFLKTSNSSLSVLVALEKKIFIKYSL